MRPHVSNDSLTLDFTLTNQCRSCWLAARSLKIRLFQVSFSSTPCCLNAVAI